MDVIRWSKICGSFEKYRSSYGYLARESGRRGERAGRYFVPCRVIPELDTWIGTSYVSSDGPSPFLIPLLHINLTPHLVFHNRRVHTAGLIRVEAPESMSGSPHAPPRPGNRLDSASGSTWASPPTRASEAGEYSYLGTMWTGLIRRFSSEDGQLDPELESSGHGEHPHTPAKDGVSGVFTPVVRRVSPFRPPPLDPLVLHGYRDSTPASARLLTATVAEEIRAMVPERLRIIEDWSLVYSLEQDGASLATLYQACRRYDGRRVGFVLVVKDQEGGVSILP